MLRNIRLMTSLMLCGWAATTVPARAQHFEQIPGSLTQIAAGRAEVWGLNGSAVFRFDASSKKFNQISGSLVQIAVGGGSLLQRDQVWGVHN
jgi:Tectonin domain